MGVLISEDVAESTPCHGVLNLETGEVTAYSKGVAGRLSDEQEEAFCKGEGKDFIVPVTSTEYGFHRKIIGKYEDQLEEIIEQRRSDISEFEKEAAERIMNRSGDSNRSQKE